MKAPLIFRKVSNLFKKPIREKGTTFSHLVNAPDTIPFHFGLANLRRTFLAYQPDSQTYFKEHSEFSMLFDSFILNNEFNNSGDVARLWSFILNIKQVLKENVPGDFAELGVWRGNTASVLAHFAGEFGRKVYLFDTYEGFDSKDLRGIDGGKRVQFDNTSIEMVKSAIGPSVDVCRFVKGYFPATVTEEHRGCKYSVVSLDCDLYEPMKAGLDFFYPRMSKGGVLLLHDYSGVFWAGAKKAIDEFCAAHDEYVVLIPDKAGSAFIRKTK